MGRPGSSRAGPERTAPATASAARSSGGTPASAPGAARSSARPRRAEQAVTAIPRQRSGTDGKVIYPTRAAAESAARELEGVGARTLRAYACVRGEHFHLATDLAGVPLHERIPQQRRPVAV